MNRFTSFFIQFMRSITISRLIIFAVVFFLWGIAYIFSDSSAVHFFSGTSNLPHTLWSFLSDHGNAGILDYDKDPVPYSRSNLYGTEMTGFFWSETTGWAEFTGSTQITLRNTTNSARTVWDASGYVWSDTAWWFTLSGVEYYPDTASLSGWLWSDTLGWSSLNTIVTNVWLGFVGRVAVIGSIAGKNIYTLNIANYQQWAHYDVSSISTVLNDTRKKVTLSLRNVGLSLINTTAPTLISGAPATLNNAVYYTHTGSSDFIVTYSYIESYLNSPLSPRSLIVVWGDIYIDTGVVLSPDTPSHAIIALKNDAGVWGNIYIRGDVTKVQSSLLSEGTLYSGRRSGWAWILYNRDHDAITSLPNYQLYIHGSVISRNTIGWAGVAWGSKCPFSEVACSYDTALRYDLNYFRDFQIGGIPATDISLHRGYPVVAYNDKSLIIEYDSRIMSDPPPGL